MFTDTHKDSQTHMTQVWKVCTVLRQTSCQFLSNLTFKIITFQCAQCEQFKDGSVDELQQYDPEL